MRRYRKKPLPLQKLDVLISRLPDTHSKMPLLRKQAAREQKGYNGERKLDYHLESLSDDYFIIHDICFRLHNQRTQIDSLIVTANAIFIVEVKSFEGIVTFQTELRQCYRDNEGKMERFKYPITQVEAIQAKLLRFLQLANLGGLPIYYFVAFAEKSTLIRVQGDEEGISKVVTYIEEVPLKIMKTNEWIASQNPAGENHRLQKKIAKHMLQHTEPFDKNILETFDIQPDDIQTGVHCPTCHQLGMERKKQKWYCPKCAASSKIAHLAALQDYVILFGPTITNAQCRNFLRLDSRHLTKYILRQSPNVTKFSRLIWQINHPSIY